MKKLLAATLVLLMILATFSSCGKVVSKIKDLFGDKEQESEQNQGMEADDTIDLGECVIIQLSDRIIYSGNLLTFKDNRYYKGTPKLIDIETARREHGVFMSLLGNKGKFKATAETAQALFDMIAACNKAVGEGGKEDDNIVISNAYNINEVNTQPAIFSSGEAVAISYFYEGTISDIRPIDQISKYKWIYDNAHKYGFIAESSDSNIFRFVGVQHATAAKNMGLYLNNYLNKLNASTVEAPIMLNETTVAYYCPISKVMVPKNYFYDISGNNIDGVIVTVDTSSNKNSLPNIGENENADTLLPTIKDTDSIDSLDDMTQTNDVVYVLYDANIREKASAKESVKIIATAPFGTALTRSAKNNTWSKVTYKTDSGATMYGYISNELITTNKKTVTFIKQENVIGEGENQTIVPVVARLNNDYNASYRLRYFPLADGYPHRVTMELGEIGIIKGGTEVTVLEVSEDKMWAKIRSSAVDVKSNSGEYTGMNLREAEGYIPYNFIENQTVDVPVAG